jgi:ribosomal protein L7/L12
MSITAEARQEVERLLKRGEKLPAIKYLCDTFNITLAESKMLVEALEKEISVREVVHVAQTIATTTLRGDLKMEVSNLLRAGKKIEAVKKVKESLRMGLKESLMLVEEVEKEINPNFKPMTVGTGCLRGGFKMFSIFFGFVGLVMAGIAMLLAYLQSETIENAEQVSGRVVELRSGSGSGTAPVIAYEWEGKPKLYTSSTYSTPPAYEINEEVPMYVNRNDPDDVLVDTFSDRWLVIVIFGGIGAFFILFSALFMFVGRKF